MDTPAAVEHITDIVDSCAELELMAGLTDTELEVLGDAKIEAVDERRPCCVSLSILALVL